jgi:hypothetical protein
MKQFPTYESIPNNAIYLGSESGDGSMGETYCRYDYRIYQPCYIQRQ